MDCVKLAASRIWLIAKPGGNGTSGRKCRSSKSGAVRPEADLYAAGIKNFKGELKLLDSFSNTWIEKFSLPVSTPDRYWYVMSALTANCSRVSFCCSRNILTNEPIVFCASAIGRVYL